jgi:hypothetical protein
MNCQIPTAAARECAFGENPLSIRARYSRSCGMPRDRSSAWIIGPYFPDRSSHRCVRSAFRPFRKSIQSSTRSFRVTVRSHVTATSPVVAASSSNVVIGADSTIGSCPIDHAVRSVTPTASATRNGLCERLALMILPRLLVTSGTPAGAGIPPLER